MTPDTFQSELRRAFDGRIRVVRDKRDHCLVVLDRTRSGTSYPAYKVACEHTTPHRLGTYRNPTDRDVAELRRRDWSEKFNGRTGAAKELMSQLYETPAEEARRRQDEHVRDITKHEVQPWAEWRTGVRNSISMSPGEKHAGGMKNRHRDTKRRVEAKVAQRRPTPTS